MIRKIVFSVMVAGLFACAGWAQSKPDYSGTWQLNVTKSDFGQVPGPDSETILIAQKGSNVTEDVEFADDQGTHKYEVSFVIDGPEITYPAESAPQIGIVTLQKIKGAWQAGSLVITEALKYQEDADVTGTNTYTLSADGKTLTMDLNLTTPMGAMERKYVFEKQDSSTAAASAAAPATPATAAAAPAKPAAAASAQAAASAAMQPSLSGTWKLNTAKSDFGQMPPPDSRTEQIEDNEPNIKIVSTWTGGPMGDGSMTMNLLTNGKESTNEVFGSEAKSIARWDADSLVVNTTMQMQDGDAAFKSTYTVSPDGKTLTVASHFSGPMGEMDMKSVYDKQP